MHSELKMLQPKNEIRFILVNTSHPGNIGAAARALKNMALGRLYLVQPKLFPHAEATARAAGADDLLADAIVVQTLAEALKGCGLVLGTSARLRALPWPLMNPKQASEEILNATEQSSVAVVFGRERTGLSNAELQLCNYHVHIPTNPDFSSLNLAAAVQVVAYELRSALTARDSSHVVEQEITHKYVMADQLELFYQRLEEFLLQIHYLDPGCPRQLMARMRRLFNRARIEEDELNILLGVLKAAVNSD